MSVIVVPLSSIIVLEDRQRKYFEEADLIALKENIMDPHHGLYTPLLVRPGAAKDTYILVAGERRYRALNLVSRAYKFGEETIKTGNAPVLVNDFATDLDAQEAELFENILRVNLTWQEQMAAVAALHKKKVAQNTKHSTGMTAALLTGSVGYAKTAAYDKVNNALLISDFLDHPKVKAAASLKEGTKIASRILEEEHLKRLREMRGKRQELKEREENEEGKENENTNTSDLFANEADTSDSLEMNFLQPVNTDSSNHIFYHDDFRNTLDKIPDGTIQVLVTDPPYGVGAEKFHDGGVNTLAHEYTEDNFEELYKALVESLDQKCTMTAHAYIFCDFEFFPTLKTMFSEQWWVRRVPIIWQRGQFGKLADGTPTGFTRTYECILYARRGKRQLAGVQSDVINISTGQQNRIHAAQKPVELYEKLITLSALPGEVIWDPFAGSGTIYHAAHRTMMQAIGSETNDKFATNIELLLEGNLLAAANIKDDEEISF